MKPVKYVVETITPEIAVGKDCTDYSECNRWDVPTS